VLEIGAGTGRNLPLYRTATRVVALEPGPGMRARAERTARAAPVPVEVVDGRAEDLPFPDHSFDTVVASLVLCTVPDPAGALAEARRVLGPGGRLRFYQHVRADDPRLAR
jgi:ubiquinone/menaquinone biosynthesis C-methylase UbiE